MIECLYDGVFAKTAYSVAQQKHVLINNVLKYYQWHQTCPASIHSAAELDTIEAKANKYPCKAPSTIPGNSEERTIGMKQKSDDKINDLFTRAYPLASESPLLQIEFQ